MPVRRVITKITVVIFTEWWLTAWKLRNIVESTSVATESHATILVVSDSLSKRGGQKLLHWLNYGFHLIQFLQKKAFQLLKTHFQLELAYQRIQREYEDLVRHKEKQEGLEKQAAAKMDIEIRRLQQDNALFQVTDWFILF